MDYTGPSDEELVDEFRQIVARTDRKAIIPLMAMLRDVAVGYPRERTAAQQPRVHGLTLINGGGRR